MKFFIFAAVVKTGVSPLQWSCDDNGLCASFAVCAVKPNSVSFV